MKNIHTKKHTLVSIDDDIYKRCNLACVAAYYCSCGVGWKISRGPRGSVMGARPGQVWLRAASRAARLGAVRLTEGAAEVAAGGRVKLVLVIWPSVNHE